MNAQFRSLNCTSLKTPTFCFFCTTSLYHHQDTCCVQSGRSRRQTAITSKFIPLPGSTLPHSPLPGLWRGRGSPTNMGNIFIIPLLCHGKCLGSPPLPTGYWVGLRGDNFLPENDQTRDSTCQLIYVHVPSCGAVPQHPPRGDESAPDHRARPDARNSNSDLFFRFAIYFADSTSDDDDRKCMFRTHLKVLQFVNQNLITNVATPRPPPHPTYSQSRTDSI